MLESNEDRGVVSADGWLSCGLAHALSHSYQRSRSEGLWKVILHAAVWAQVSRFSILPTITEGKLGRGVKGHKRHCLSVSTSIHSRENWPEAGEGSWEGEVRPAIYQLQATAELAGTPAHQ